MAFAVGPEGCVFGFEPNPGAFAVLEANSRLNPGRIRIVPLPYAAGDAPGKLFFKYSDPGLCNGGELRGLSRWRHAHAFEIEVEAIHAESWLRERYPAEIAKLKYIKVDSEGADARILRSMSGLIDEFRPYLRCEIYRHMPEEERRDFFRFLMDAVTRSTASSASPNTGENARSRGRREPTPLRYFRRSRGRLIRTAAPGADTRRAGSPV